MDSVTLVSQLILPYLFPIFKKILTISARYSYLSLVLPFGYGSVLISLLSLRASSGGEKTHLFRQRSSTGSLRSPLTSYLKLRWLSESGKVKFFFFLWLEPLLAWMHRSRLPSNCPATIWRAPPSMSSLVIWARSPVVFYCDLIRATALWRLRVLLWSSLSQLQFSDRYSLTYFAFSSSRTLIKAVTLISLF